MTVVRCDWFVRKLGRDGNRRAKSKQRAIKTATGWHTSVAAVLKKWAYSTVCKKERHRWS